MTRLFIALTSCMTLSPLAERFGWDGNITRMGARFKETSNILLTIGSSSL